VIQMSINKDVNAEHTVYLDGEHALTEADFVL
jgi:hypothetical protein